MKDIEYMHGFCKAAMDAGVNPVLLAKFAASKGDKGILSSLVDGYNNLDPYMRRAILGGLATGLGTYMFSNPYNPSRLSNSLLAGAAGGLGTYALDSTGATDSIIDLIKDNLAKLRPAKKYSPAGELMHDAKRVIG